MHVGTLYDQLHAQFTFSSRGDMPNDTELHIFGLCILPTLTQPTGRTGVRCFFIILITCAKEENNEKYC